MGKKIKHTLGIENIHFRYANADKTIKKWIINRDIIFVHVPKCAGKSVWDALHPDLRNEGEHNIIPGHLPLPSTIHPEGAFTFGFVRNPWDRMVSMYNFLCFKAGRDGKPERKKLLESLGFKRYVLEFYYRRFINPDILKEHDKLILVNRWDICLDTPIQKRSQMYWLEGCTFIGRFENLENDLNEASRLGGFKLNPLMHLNSCAHKHYTEYYDSDTIAFIEEHFKQEIDRFGYKYGEN